MCKIEVKFYLVWAVYVLPKFQLHFVVALDHYVANIYFMLNALFQMDLATFLISRACHNATLANYFCW